jgi:enterochelin esterase-like enzyme
LKRIIKREELNSKHLGETKEILVYLPDDEEKNGEYPLLVLHDGPDYFNLGRIVTQATRMMEQKKIIPFMMAAVPVQKEKRTSEYSPIGQRQPLHMNMIVEELLPLIRTKYPASRKKEDLVIGGSSLGGTVSLHIALTYPEVCDQVLSQSGAFMEATTEQILRQPSLSRLKLYQSVGTSETAVPTHLGTFDLVARNREIYRSLKEKNAQVHYIEDEGDHTWGFWQRDLPRALQTFFGTE